MRHKKKRRVKKFAVTQVNRENSKKGGPALYLAACILPFVAYVAIYARDLWQLPHYQFFPIVFAAVVSLTYERWPKRSELRFSRSWLAFAIVYSGIFVELVGTAFASPWQSYLGFCLIVIGLGISIHPVGTQRFAFASIGLLLLLVWRPPFNRGLMGDTWLIARLQIVSSRLSSWVLDFFGIVHALPGTVLQLPDASFGVAEACSGIQSFFTIVSIAAIYSVANRLSWIRTLILLFMGAFWAIVMNTVRISFIPVAHEWFGIDLAHGWRHDLLGYLVLFLAVVLVASSKALIDHVPLPSAPVWGFRSATSERHTAPFWLKLAAGLTVIIGILQIGDFVSALRRDRSKIVFFDRDIIVPLYESSMPNQLGSWQRTNFTAIDRVRGSDLGQFSNIWQYKSEELNPVCSLDQAFPGWHELSTCYTNQGWKLTERVRSTAQSDGEDWDFITVKLEMPTGEYGLLFFGFFDGNGRPVAAPAQWTSWASLKNRIQNRLSDSVRQTLLQGEAYQTQLFITNSEPFSEPQINLARAQYLVAREELRKSFSSQSELGIH